MPKLLTILTAFLIVAGFSFNLGEQLRGTGRMTSEYAYSAACEWPVLAFGVGVLFGANALAWVREYPWAALIATFAIGHCLWPIFRP